LNELKNWRLSEHWNTKKFFRALIFGLLFTFLDTVTDIVSARSVPDECPDSGFSERISNNFIIKICEEISGSLLFQKRMGIGSDNHCGHFFLKRSQNRCLHFHRLTGNHAQLLSPSQNFQRIVEKNLWIGSLRMFGSRNQCCCSPPSDVPLHRTCACAIILGGP